MIRGIASTPDIDRVGDIVDPWGATFDNPVPVLHQHHHRRPVGTVTFKRPSARGIAFEATLAGDLPAGELRDHIDTAWQEVELGLVRSASIGFRPLKTPPISTGTRSEKYELIELSLVTMPANSGAVITGVGEKSAGRKVRHDVPLVRVSPRAGQPVRLGGGRAVKIADSPAALASQASCGCDPIGGIARYIAIAALGPAPSPRVIAQVFKGLCPRESYWNAQVSQASGSSSR